MAAIEAKGLLVKVSEQMKRLDGNISTFDRSLEQTPKVFHSVDVNLTVNVFLRMVDYAVDILLSKVIVRSKTIGVNNRSRFNVIVASRVLRFVFDTTIVRTSP